MLDPQGFLKSFLGFAKSLVGPARPLLGAGATPIASSRIPFRICEVRCEVSQTSFGFRGNSNGVTPTPIPDRPRPKKVLADPKHLPVDQRCYLSGSIDQSRESVRSSLKRRRVIVGAALRGRPFFRDMHFIMERAATEGRPTVGPISSPTIRLRLTKAERRRCRIDSTHRSE